MADDVKVTVSDNVSGNIEKKLRAIGVEARQANTYVQQLRQALNTLSAGQQLQQAARHATQFGTAVRQAGAATQTATGQLNRYNAALRTTGQNAQRASAGVAGLGTRTRAFGTIVHHANGGLGQLVGYLAAVAGVHTLLDIANEAQQLDNQLRTIARSQAEYNRLQEQLFSLSQRTRTSVADTTQLYVNFSKVLADIGVGEAEMFRMVETLNKGFQIGGKTAQEAAGATRQFIQALQSGVLRGQELNSVMEQMPIQIINALAEAAGTTVEKLRAVAMEGQLTRDVLRDALGIAAKEIDALFARTVPTIQNAFTFMRNEAVRFFTENIDGANSLSNALIFLGQNIETVIPIVVALGAAWATVQIVTIIASIGQLGLAFLALASPVIAATAAFVGFVGIALLLGETIARLTGNFEAWDAWLNETVESIGDNIIGLIRMGKEAGLIQGATAKTDQFAGALDNAALSAEELRKGVQVIAGGVQRVNGELATTAVQGQAAAGAILSVSGNANGVYDVAEALKSTNREMEYLTNNGQHTVTALTSVSGKVNGIYQIAEATRDAADAMSDLTSWAQKAQQALSRVGGTSGTLRTPVNSPSFTNLGGGSNLGGGNSIQQFAQGGSFMVRGRSGIDKNMVRFRASEGERVDILTPRQQRQRRRGLKHFDQFMPKVVNQTFNIVTPDPDAFRASRRQIAGDYQMLSGG